MDGEAYEDGCPLPTKHRPRKLSHVAHQNGNALARRGQTSPSKKGGLDLTGQGPEFWARGQSAKGAKGGKVHDFGMRLVPLTFSQSENTAFHALVVLCPYFR